MGRCGQGHRQPGVWHDPPPRRIAPAGQRLAPHPIPEVITVAIFTTLVCRIDGWTQLLAYSWFTAVGVSLAVTDLTVRRLPNALIIPTYPALLALFCVDAVPSHSTTPLLRSAASMMVTLVAFTALGRPPPGTQAPARGAAVRKLSHRRVHHRGAGERLSRRRPGPRVRCARVVDGSPGAVE